MMIAQRTDYPVEKDGGKLGVLLFEKSEKVKSYFMECCSGHLGGWISDTLLTHF